MAEKSFSIPRGLHTPQEIARLFADYRNWRLENHPHEMPFYPAVVPLSRDGLERLATFAYYASLQAEEGRYPRVRIIVADEAPKARPRLVVRFPDPIPVTGPEVIRRLAPAVGSVANALLVAERSSLLFCDGFAEVEACEGDFIVGDSVAWDHNRYNALIINVESPGELRLSEMWLNYQLRAGKGWPTESFASALGIHQWLSQLSQVLIRRACDENEPQDLNLQTGLSGVCDHPLVTAVWSQVLMTAANLRHGGAFVIHSDPQATLLADGRPHATSIRLSYPAAGLSLGSQLTRFWRSNTAAGRVKDRVGYAEAAREAIRAKHDLFVAATAVGNLSAADGCVVLDRELTLHGFGGEIIVEEKDLQAHGLTYVAHGTNEPLDQATLVQRFGTRHRSAFRLCKAVPNTIAFVVSQDGDLRVFQSDEEHVYLAEAMSPAFRRPELA